MAALAASAFGAFGLWSGSSAVLLADLSRPVGLSPGPLGIALLAGATASMVSMWSPRWTADRFGRRGYLFAVTCVFGVGISSLVLARSFAALVVSGFLLVGLAISGMAPLAQSSAGDLFPERAGDAASVVITFGSGGGLLAAPLVGGLAELTGLRISLGLVVVAGLAVSLLSLRPGPARG